MTGDGHTRVQLLTIGGDRTNIGPFVRLSFGIVGPPLLFLTHRLELREWRKNLWQAKKLPKQVAKVHCRVAFVCRPCRSWDHRKDILSSRVMFLFKSCIHRRNRPSIIMRTYHEHNKKLPDCVKKSTRLRESTSRPPLIHRVFCAAWLQPEQNRTRTKRYCNNSHKAVIVKWIQRHQHCDDEYYDLTLVPHIKQVTWKCLIDS